MPKPYKHLSLEERALIQVWLEHDLSLSAIAGKLGRATSTITREFSRNTCQRRSKFPHLGSIHPAVTTRSPSLRCARHRPPLVRALPVATAAPTLSTEPSAWLASPAWRARWSLTTLCANACLNAYLVASRLSRPAAYCDSCQIPFASATNPSTPPCTPCPEENCAPKCWHCCHGDAKHSGFSWGLPDNGKEMAHHQTLSKDTGIKVFFAHPYSPWERGINENTNGLLRRVLPKKHRPECLHPGAT